MREDILLTPPTYVENFTGTLADTAFTAKGIKHDDYVGYDWGVIRVQNAVVRDNQLVLSMSKRPAPKTFKGSPDKARGWDTGWVTTKGNLSFVQGAVEVAARVPNRPVESAGVWACGWLRPENKEIGGEIDFFESFGDLGQNAKATRGYPNRYTATVHYDQTGKNRDDRMSPISPAKQYEDTCLYGVVKTAEEVIFYFQREEIHRVERASNPAAFDKAFPPGEPFYLILCLQAGSAWWGQPTEGTAEVSEFVVDSVRVWDFDK